MFASSDGRWVMASKTEGAGKGLYAIEVPEHLDIKTPLKHQKVKTEGNGKILLGTFWDDETFIAGFPDTLERVTRG